MEDSAVIIGSRDQLDSILKPRLPVKFDLLDPRNFVVLLPDPVKPSIWIGGRSNEDATETAKFLNDNYELLFQKVIVKGDYHIHTTESDGRTQPADICFHAAHGNVDVIAVTDHNTVAGAHAVSAQNPSPDNFMVIIGAEVTDNDNNHLLVYGQDEGFQRPDVKEMLHHWRDENWLIVQAHPTDARYFTHEQGRAIGIEAFNFLSSAPEKGRLYAQDMLKKGCIIPVLGCSDAHFPEEIGNAVTFSVFDSDADIEKIPNALSAGNTTAFFLGTFFGKDPDLNALQKLYKYTNLLSTKLRPLSQMMLAGIPWAPAADSVQSKPWRSYILPAGNDLLFVDNAEKVEAYIDGELVIFHAHGGTFTPSRSRGRERTLWIQTEPDNVEIQFKHVQWQLLQPAASTSGNSVYCNWEDCHCRDIRYELPQTAQSYLIDCGDRSQAVLQINCQNHLLTLFHGSETDVTPFLQLGENEISWTPEGGSPAKAPVLLLGEELHEWEISFEEKPWDKIVKASNLQCLGYAPKGFQGEFSLRTSFPSRDIPSGDLSFYFAGIDGEASIFLNDVLLHRRGAYHWEDALDLPVSRELFVSGSNELRVDICNEVGLCGLINWVFICRRFNLRNPLSFALENMPDLQLVRCGREAMKAMFCREDGSMIVDWKAGAALRPRMVAENEEKPAYLVLNGLADEAPPPVWIGRMLDR